MSGVWLMDSEVCCKCGAILDYFESTICTFCQEDEAQKERAREMDGFDGWTVYCSYGGHSVPESDAVQTGERVGSDLIVEPVYLCFACAQEMEDAEDDA